MYLSRPITEHRPLLPFDPEYVFTYREMIITPGPTFEKKNTGNINIQVRNCKSVDDQQGKGEHLTVIKVRMYHKDDDKNFDRSDDI